MVFKLPSFIEETFTTTGTGAITLGGATTRRKTFAAELSNGDTCFYASEGGADYEEGFGTYSGGVLTRTTVRKSSNGDAAVDWPAGTKTIRIAPLGPSDLDGANLRRFQSLMLRPTVFTLADDTATSFDVPYTDAGFQAQAIALLSVSGTSSANPKSLIFIRAAGTPRCALLNIDGTAPNTATGALAGTTGTDVKITVSAHTDGKLYVENRLGSSRTFTLLFLPAGSDI
ncbi:MAG: hypothetical protein KDK07_07915 [Bauldia sp.]|nr:hypothetical protein [Bauldia sp.]